MNLGALEADTTNLACPIDTPRNNRNGTVMGQQPEAEDILGTALGRALMLRSRPSSTVHSIQ
jgi:hypothetical protein